MLTYNPNNFYCIYMSLLCTFKVYSSIQYYEMIDMLKYLLLGTHRLRKHDLKVEKH